MTVVIIICIITIRIIQGVVENNDPHKIIIFDF
jgi:hypothetical protein